MTRIPLTQERQLATTVHSIRDYLLNLKRPQVVGASSLRLKRTITADTWDINGATILAGATDATWRVTFTPDIDRRAYAQLDLTWSITPSFGDEQIISFDDPSDVASEATKSWIVGMIPYGRFDPSTISFKFSVRSTSTGTLSWTRLT